MAICALLALGYALFAARTWEASQTLILRDEAAGGEEGIGRFRRLDDMKVTQETILGIVNGEEVLQGALRDVGPADGAAAAAFPTGQNVADLRDALRLTPPDGSEFGKTEIFYLKVKDRDPRRAVALCSAVAKRLLESLRKLRNAKAQSMIDELDKSVALSERDLQASTARLGALEARVGGDLAELRMMEMTATGDSDIRRRLNQIETELRAAKLAQRSNEELLRLLQAAKNEPGALLATPNRLLESQPGLRRLKEGLVDAQLHSAKLLGIMSEEHPMVIASRESESEVRSDLHRELAVAISGVNVDLRLTSERVHTLAAQRSETIARLDKLAGLRAAYSTLVADVRHRTTLAEAAAQSRGGPSDPSRRPQLEPD